MSHYFYVAQVMPANSVTGEKSYLKELSKHESEESATKERHSLIGAYIEALEFADSRALKLIKSRYIVIEGEPKPSKGLTFESLFMAK